MTKKNTSVFTSIVGFWTCYGCNCQIKIHSLISFQHMNVCYVCWCFSFIVVIQCVSSFYNCHSMTWQFHLWSWWTPQEVLLALLLCQLPSQLGPQDSFPYITQACKGNCAMGPFQVDISLAELSLCLKLYVGVMVFAFYFQVLMWWQLHQWEFNCLGYATATIQGISMTNIFAL